MNIRIQVPRKSEIIERKRLLSKIIAELISFWYSLKEISEYTNIHKVILSNLYQKNYISLSLEKADELTEKLNMFLMEVKILLNE